MDLAAKLTFARHLWRWYSLLVIANLLDLVFTYFGLSHGFFHEGNPIVAAQLYTFWPMGIKAGGLALLALGIVAVLRTTRRPRQRQMLAFKVVVATVGIYGFVIFLHVVYFLIHGV